MNPINPSPDDTKNGTLMPNVANPDPIPGPTTNANDTTPPTKAKYFGRSCFGIKSVTYACAIDNEAPNDPVMNRNINSSV
mmetsp:Transcript_49345/g.60603  ORF Transcript_49345/g.60603 Transcript_49345/m.60603 type:complete len:80 (+) Transcript_49345:1143-1382(+)